jgi:hypothetical protein
VTGSVTSRDTTFRSFNNAHTYGGALLGCDKSRSEMICADFLAGSATEENQSEVLVLSLERLYQTLMSAKRSWLEGLKRAMCTLRQKQPRLAQNSIGGSKISTHLMASEKGFPVTRHEPKTTLERLTAQGYLRMRLRPAYTVTSRSDRSHSRTFCGSRRNTPTSG